MKRETYLVLLLLFAFFPSCNNSLNSNQENTPEVKNIIFMIGDGMGITQVNAAMNASGERLNFEQAESVAFCKTHSASHKITDSAAGGTAMATGHKTGNGVIGQDTSGNVLKTILEFAEENGLSSGLVSSSSITHATPASFIAHKPNRNMYEAIAMDFLSTDVEVIIGGGYDHFADRKDELDLTDSMKANGYAFFRSMEELRSSDADKLVALLAGVHLPPAAEGRGNMLPEATAKALDILSENEEGFFLMVESSQIDWGGHDNNVDYVVTETLDFDKAIGVAREFVELHPGTLLVVTADHETGGMTLPSAEDDYNKISGSFSTEGHTAVMVPVFAYGTGAELFTGVMDNTGFFPRFMKLYGFRE